MQVPIETITKREAIPSIRTERWQWICPACGNDVYEKTSTSREEIAADACCAPCRQKIRDRPLLTGYEIRQ